MITLPPFAHSRQALLEQEERTEDVNTCLNTWIGVLRDRPDRAADPGVAEQHVELPKPVVSPEDRGRDAVLVGYVGDAPADQVGIELGRAASSRSRRRPSQVNPLDADHRWPGADGRADRPAQRAAATGEQRARPVRPEVLADDLVARDRLGQHDRVVVDEVADTGDGIGRG
jgi:hypothetical protein